MSKKGQICKRIHLSSLLDKFIHTYIIMNFKSDSYLFLSSKKIPNRQNTWDHLWAAVCRSKIPSMARKEGYPSEIGICSTFLVPQPMLISKSRKRNREHLIKKSTKEEAWDGQVLKSIERRSCGGAQQLNMMAEHGWRRSCSRAYGALKWSAGWSLGPWVGLGWLPPI